MFIRPAFPNSRRRDPTRQAELRVYDHFANSRLPGCVLYEAKASQTAPEVDFAIWLQDRARIALQVKGGRYTVRTIAKSGKEGQLHDEGLVHRGDGGEVEGVQALDGGEAGGADPALHHALVAVDEFQLRQPQ